MTHRKPPRIKITVFRELHRSVDCTNESLLDYLYHLQHFQPIKIYFFFIRTSCHCASNHVDLAVKCDRMSNFGKLFSEAALLK